MNVIEFLDLVARVELRDRADIVEGPDDSMWSDETLIGYLNECMWVVAREVGGRRSVVAVTVDGATKQAPLPPNTMRVDAVSIGQNRPTRSRHSFDKINNTIHVDVLETTDVNVYVEAAQQFTLSSLTDAIQVPPGYISMVVDYVVSMALRNRDVDVESRRVSQDRELSFYGKLAALSREIKNNRRPTTSWGTV